MGSSANRTPARSRLRRMRRASLSPKDCQRAAERISEIVFWLGVRLAERDRALVGDCGSLYVRIPYVWKLLDELLAVPLDEKHLQRIRHGIGALWAEMDNLHELARDMAGPLDRLHTAALKIRRVGGKEASSGKRSAEVTKGRAKKRK